MIIMVVLYTKVRIFLVILTVFLFSLVIGMSSLEQFDIPFSPYIQIFFLVFQSIFFLMTSIEVYYYKKE